MKQGTYNFLLKVADAIIFTGLIMTFVAIVAMIYFLAKYLFWKTLIVVGLVLVGILLINIGLWLGNTMAFINDSGRYDQKVDTKDI